MRPWLGLAWATALAIGAVAGAVRAQPPPAPVRHFDVDEYRVEGNKVLPNEAIEAAVYPYLGPGRTAEDVEKARAALEALYAAKGYPTVSAAIPEQRVGSGVIVLVVTSRTVGRLRVTGSRYYDLDAIKAGAPSLAEGKVPNMKSVQRDIVALNQWPDRTVTPSLKAGAAPDTVDVDLQVQDHFPGHATLELNNRQVQGTQPLRLSGSLSYDNLFQRGDSATFAWQVAPQDPSNTTVFSGSYLFHIPDSTVSLLASYLHSNSNVSTVGSTTVIGKGDIAGLRLLVPLGFEEGFLHTLSTGMDYKKLTENDIVGSSVNQAPITYYPATISYQAYWDSDKAQTALTASSVFTFGGIGSSARQFDQKRAFATPGFILARGDLAHTHTLPYDIQLYGHVGVQAAPQPLVSSEQLGLGGLDTVRGYLESEVLGDYGGFLQTEIRSPSLADLAGAPYLNELRAIVFFDTGTAEIHNPLLEQKQSYTLTSTGLGFRIRLLDYLNGELLGAFALTTATQTHAGSSRVLFRVYGDF